MAWWLPWQRVVLAAPVPVPELQRRLAEATADWNVGGWGSPVPPPPWTRPAFVATKGVAWLTFLPIVVAGSVRPDGAGARLEATVRVHGSWLFGTALFLAFLGYVAATALPAGAIAVGAYALLSYLLVVGLARERIRSVLAVLTAACEGRLSARAPAGSVER